ncbi:MAG: SRPBCC family protein [Proteobacteria bacterium]|nr:SRPBCC family protein [Pseudomonadota bacterium]
MARRIEVSHAIIVEAPIDRCFMYFTPAGEELWVDGWQPAYVEPPDGRTEAGMVFTTGAGAELTIWMLVDFDPVRHRSRYARCTLGSRTGFVEVQCAARDAGTTEVRVAYTLTALSADGEAALAAFEGERYAAMIDGWARELAARREVLAQAVLR